MFTAIKPNLRIDVQLLVGGVEAAEFDAAVWEPVDADSPGRLELSCTSTFQAINAMPAGPHELRGALGSTSLNARGVWIKSFEREHPERKHARPRLYLTQVYELEIKTQFGTPTVASTWEVQYFLTPCKLLNPAAILERFPSGQVNHRLVHRLEFLHPTLGRLAFDEKHGLVETAPGVRSETATLCLHLLDPVELPVVEIDEAIRSLLALAGFAARYPVRLWGRQSADATTLSRSYFQALTSWTPDWEQPPRDELISKLTLSEFLSSSLVTVSKLSARQQDATRHAMLAVHSMHGTLEDQFRSIFSALEGLCQAFDDGGNRRLTATEKARQRKIQRAVTQALDALKKSEPSIDVESTLKRVQNTTVPPDRRFRAFAAVFGVPVSDLWPVYRDGSPGLDLYSIRNRLSHGSPFTDEKLNSVHAALEHLKLLVERCLIRILGWDVSRSDASSAAVNALLPVKDMHRLKAALG